MALHADIEVGKPAGKIIDPNVYGHFSEHLGHCIYGGFYVGEDSDIPNVNGMRTDVVEAFKKIRTPVMRWPGGCFADEYHWMDGIGPKEKRPSMINTHWGGVIEDNSFGTHEFFELCRQIGCEPYVSGNLGSGTIEEFSKWVEYMTSEGTPMAELRARNGQEKPWKLKYWGIGNENWGCGGDMTPEFYASLARRYATYSRNYGDNELYKIYCGPLSLDFNWTEVLMRQTAPKPGEFTLFPRISGLSLHHYVGVRTRATEFDEKGWFTAQKGADGFDYMIATHGKIMDKYDPEKKIALVMDEWAVSFDNEPGTNPGFLYQQSAQCSAVFAGICFNIMHRYADRLRMANVAQAVNVIQSLVLTEGSRMLLTPTYHVFDMYKEHQGAEVIETCVDSDPYTFGIDAIPAVTASASLKDGKVLLTLTNASYRDDAEVSVSIACDGPVEGTILATQAPTSHNTFDDPENVKPAAFTGVARRDGGLTVTLPAYSVVALRIG